MTIGIVEFLGLADSMAAQSQELAKEMGDGIVAGTASFGAQSNVGRITNVAIAQPDVTADLLEPFMDQVGKMITYPNAYSKHEVGMKALNRHTGGVNAYIAVAGERVAPEFKWALEMLAIESLDAANTFSPVVDPMDDVTITGPNSATWIDIADIDTENYYAARLELYKISGAAPPDLVTLNLLCTKWDGTIIPIGVLVDAANPAGTITPIETIPGEMFTAVTLSSVVCGPGAAGQHWKVNSRLERVVNL